MRPPFVPAFCQNERCLANDREHFLLPARPDRLGTLVVCPRCQKQTLAPPPPEFGAVEWDTFAAHEGLPMMGDALRILGVTLTARQRLLVALATFPSAHAEWAEEPRATAADALRAMADGAPPPGADTAVRQAARGAIHRYNLNTRHRRPDWAFTAEECFDGNPPEPDFFALERGREGIVAALREFVANPFVEWNTEWATATVRHLAQRIDAEGDYGAMPILADALQDAECDAEPVLAHCRANRTHARGCWVLGAILGKS